MNTQKNVTFEDFKTAALSTEEISQLKGGEDRYANVEIIVDWN
ncbi:MAG: hypothetical protein ACPGVB_09845 [Chitinophagales bacterium]